ncbi:MAG: hypothetical protein LBE92_13860 [Chryseobacterium sp.]|jgi:hypothetical protein|uniref:hypothetical protein n=1 Tax=Chryseobacterium sp. TaxID=1871047 RepID=UPI00281A942E|nr:hypothetical protein [Chryseobacterium sp.]MDR2237202.1 hypothetical protein [Chryseobacterium sp.]
MIKKSLLLIVLLLLLSCNKVENIKHKIVPDNPYLAAKIDKFYWETLSEDHNVVPLIKPYQLMQVTGSKEWYLPTQSKDSFNFKNGSTVDLYSLTTVTECNIFPPYIFGIDEEIISNDPDTDIPFPIKPRLYFIINSESNKLEVYEDREQYKDQLKKLRLPNSYSTPDYLFEQFKDNPILPWFPEDVKQQLEEIKSKK